MILLLQKGNRVVGNLSILKWCEFTMNNLEDKDIQPKESDGDTYLFGICSNFLRFMLRSEFIFSIRLNTKRRLVMLVTSRLAISYTGKFIIPPCYFIQYQEGYTCHFLPFLQQVRDKKYQPLCRERKRSESGRQ